MKLVGKFNFKQCAPQRDSVKKAHAVAKPVKLADLSVSDVFEPRPGTIALPVDELAVEAKFE